MLEPLANNSSFIKIRNKQTHRYHVQGACHREGMRPFFCQINYKSQPRTYFGTHRVTTTPNDTSFIKIGIGRHMYNVWGACHREGMRPFFINLSQNN